MAPVGDVAPALEVCRVAAGGGRLDVVGPLALDALHRIVPGDVALWADVDVAGGGRPATLFARPAPADEGLLARYAAHVATGEANGGAGGGGGPTVHRDDDGHQAGLVVPAPAGHRAGMALRRSTPFTAVEGARLDAALPLLVCAVLAAGPAPVAGTELLTRREAAVLRSVARGLSDKQTARALGVSPRTVGKHLEHIYAKLGVAGRTEAAARVWGR